jgi:hypothetical protein
MSDDQPRTYSIQVRVRRTTVEFAYVLVPVDSQIMRTDEAGVEVRDEKGSARIDGEKFAAQAVALAASPIVEWYQESSHIEPHPLQKPREENEQAAYFHSPAWE